MNLALYFSCSVPDCFIARINLPPRISVCSFISFLGTKANTYHCSNPWNSSGIALLTLYEVYRGFDLTRLFDGHCSSAVHYVPCFSMLSISCLISGLFACGGICRIDVMLICFTFISN